MTNDVDSPLFVWDWGTAYDFFASLNVLHDPSSYGVDGVWAAGVRSRLPPPERAILQDAAVFACYPYYWTYALPAPKDGETVLWTLKQIPPQDRLLTLLATPETPREVQDVLENIVGRGTWDRAEQQIVRSRCKRMGAPGNADVLLGWSSRAHEFGERFLAALRTYYEVFFAEEEKRIAPFLQQALDWAQGLAEQLSLPELIERLSQGVRLSPMPEASEWVLAPSFWVTPYVTYGRISAERFFFQFGARPAEVSLVPGGVVPDALTSVLKALSSPTRLRMLRYLAAETLTGAQLARRLRLRPATVSHHVKALRLARLVHLTVEEERELYYAIRPGRVAEAFAALREFLGEDESESGA
jgi:DNA-binding transcriptional ArsR family regulator